jgi:hypothetical protein
MSTDSSAPRAVRGVEGLVERDPVGKGSKSARNALWIDTAQGRFVLRRKDGPTFGDTSLDHLVGQRVTCSGFIVGYSLLVEHIALL